MLAPTLEAADEADEAAELTAELAEAEAELTALETDSDAEARAPLEKMVVLPTVLVMVLPSVVMVERISEVVIAPPLIQISQLSLDKKEESEGGLTAPPAVPEVVVLAVSAGLLTVPDAVTAVTAAPGLEKVPDAGKRPVSTE